MPVGIPLVPVMNSILKVFLLVLAVSAILAVPYHVGKNSGKLEVSSAWAAADKERADKVSELTQANQELELANQAANTRISDELAAKEKEHAEAMAALRADLTGRLQLATTREGIYQRQAQGSSLERERLASHAAELDRSLEQGRSLVRELGQTLGQRDRTIRALGQVILNDRTLLSGDAHGD